MLVLQTKNCRQEVTRTCVLLIYQETELIRRWIHATTVVRTLLMIATARRATLLMIICPPVLQELVNAHSKCKRFPAMTKGLTIMTFPIVCPMIQYKEMRINSSNKLKAYIFSGNSCESLSHSVLDIKLAHRSKWY